MEIENKTVTSAKYAINWKDALRGLLIAVISAPFTIIQSSIEAGDLSFDWKKIGTVALLAGLSYLAKNFFTPATIQIPIKDSEINENDPKAAK